MYKKIATLIECFEFIAVNGLNVGEVAKDIYAELIEIGYLPSDLLNEHEIADMILVEFRYEIASEDMLEFLVFHILRCSLLDIMAAVIEA